MGTASKVTSVVFRLGAFISAAIVLGIVSRFLHLVGLNNGPNNGRVIYTEVLAAISVVFSLLLMPPFKYSFFAFPLDFIIFVMWMVSFGLLVNVSQPNLSCTTISSEKLIFKFSLLYLEYAPQPGIGTIGDIIGAGYGLFPIGLSP